MRITDYRLTFIVFAPAMELMTGAVSEQDVLYRAWSSASRT